MCLLSIGILRRFHERNLPEDKAHIALMKRLYQPLRIGPASVSRECEVHQPGRSAWRNRFEFGIIPNVERRLVAPRLYYHYIAGNAFHLSSTDLALDSLLA